MNKLKRIENSKSKVGSRHTRKLKKYSTNFNKMFTFYLNSYRSGILTFCGDRVTILNDSQSNDAKYCFRLYDNGFYNLKDIESRHSNILKSIIIAKKAWGLWVDQWTDGICDWSFTKDDILKEFEDKNIKIPESLLLEFNNMIKRKKEKRNSEYLLQLRNK